MERVDYMTLIHKSLTAQIKPEEDLRLQQWLKESPLHQKEYDEIKEVWDTPVEEESLSEEDFQASSERVQKKLTSSIKREQRTRRGLTASIVLISIAFLALLFTCLHFFRQPAVPAITYSVSSHDNKSVTLADSSVVWMNDFTTISNSLSEQERIVDLKGEAFFEIRKEKRPFTVRSGDCLIHVKGTAFFVKAFPSQPVEVIVKRGKVEVVLNEKRWILDKGQSLSLEDGFNSSVSDTATLNFDSWLTGKLEFKRTPLKDVIHEVEKYYRIKCTLPRALEDCQFTATFERTSLNDVIKILSYALKIKFTVIGENTYVISGKGCTT